MQRKREAQVTDTGTGKGRGPETRALLTWRWALHDEDTQELRAPLGFDAASLFPTALHPLGGGLTSRQGRPPRKLAQPPAPDAW